MPGRRKTAKSFPGFYSPGETMKVIGITDRNLLRSFVDSGRLTPEHPGGKATAQYKIEQVEALANELRIFILQSSREYTDVEIRSATPADAAGIVAVLTSRGWKTATALQRISWYEVNPCIDFLVSFKGEIAGYINAAPYVTDAMEDMMSGRKRSWHMTPDDILSYEKGKIYDLYVGVAVKQDLPNHTFLASRLIAGFIVFLKGLAKQGIRFSHLYAVSAEPDGQKLCDDLGFERQPAQEGDLFPRYVLNLETSNSSFAKQYRKAVH